MTRVLNFLSPSDLSLRLASDDPPVVIDVRRTAAFDADPRGVPGALRGPPDAIPDWSRRLPPDRAVVVYCVHGHEVSQGTAAVLSTAGFDVWVLEGGIEGWKDFDRSAMPVGPLSSDDDTHGRQV